MPTTIDKATVIWRSSNSAVIDNDGAINPPSVDSTELTLTAKIIYNEQEVERVFRVKVMPPTTSYILGYTRSTDVAKSPGEMEDNIRAITNVLHLAYSYDSGENYTALHNNTGILFPLVDFGPDAINGETKVLKNPYIFRMKDGSFGIVATRSTVDGEQAKIEKTSMILFTSVDMIKYKEIGLINLNTDLTVSHPVVEIDSMTGNYRIEWTTSNGTVYYNTTSDFTDVSQPEKQVAYKITQETPSTNIKYAVPHNQIAVSDMELKAIINKFSRVINTVGL